MSKEQYLGLIAKEHIPIYIELLKQYGKGTVLELGCGPKDPSKNISTWVDSLIEMDVGKTACEFFSGITLPKNTFFIKGDIRDQPLPDSSIDLTLMIGSYGDCIPYYEYTNPKYKDIKYEEVHNLTNQSKNKLITETNRTLKPKGILIVSNSTMNQKPEETLPKFEKYFDTLDTYIGEERYLILARSNK